MSDAADRGTPLVGAEGGVELRSLMVSSPALVPGALAPLAARPVDVDPRVRSDWEACGIRVAAVPLGRLEALQASLVDPERPSNLTRQWVAPGPAWVEAVKEPGSAESRVIALHDSRFRAQPGALRLLVRCWSEPVARRSADGERAGTLMHVEFAPQSVPRVQSDAWSRSLEASTAPRTLDEQGLIFRRLIAAFRLDPGEGLVIAYEAPGVEWTTSSTKPDPGPAQAPRDESAEIQAAKLGEVRLDGAPSEPAAEKQAGEEPSGGQFLPGAGSQLLRAPTLGELLFTGGATRASAGGVSPRIVLIVAPRVRDEFRLLGP